MILSDFSVQFCKSEIKPELLCSMSLISAFGTKQSLIFVPLQVEFQEMLLEPRGWISHFTIISDSPQVSGNNPGKGIVKGLNCTAGRSKWFHLFHPDKTLEILESRSQCLRNAVRQREKKWIWTLKSDLVPQKCAKHREKNSVWFMKPWLLFPWAVPTHFPPSPSDPAPGTFVSCSPLCCSFSPKNIWGFFVGRNHLEMTIS